MSLVLIYENWSRRYSAVLVSFSAGVLLGAGVLHILPESMELTTRAPLFFLLGDLLAVAGGSFIYIAASDLIPESHRSRGLGATLALCGGILLAWLAGLLAH